MVIWFVSQIAIKICEEYLFFMSKQHLKKSSLAVGIASALTLTASATFATELEKGARPDSLTRL